VEDYLTGKSLGRAAGRFVVDAVEPHSGRVLALRTGRAKKPKEKSEAGF
jgi:hypothetical protein